MATTPAFASFQISVAFKDGRVACEPDPLQIPADTIATITWAPAGDNAFTFLQFEWCHSNGFLAQDPIIHDQCVVAVVNNTVHGARGQWSYQLKIQVGDRVHVTGGNTANNDGKPRIHTQ